MTNDFNNILSVTSSLQKELETIISPPDDGLAPHSYQVLPNAITKGTRVYIERVSQQINGCYENGWYDACSVMMRKLLETVIIEVFESKNISQELKNNDGDFLFLKDLIDITLKHTEFNLGRNVKKGLPKLKDVGDKAAHGRRYTTQRLYIDELKNEFRDTIQELLILAKLSN